MPQQPLLIRRRLSTTPLDAVAVAVAVAVAAVQSSFVMKTLLLLFLCRMSVVWGSRPWHLDFAACLPRETP